MNLSLAKFDIVIFDDFLPPPPFLGD